jgi:hypothetical protein
MNKIIELVAAATLLVLLPAGCEVDTSGTEVSAAGQSIAPNTASVAQGKPEKLIELVAESRFGQIATVTLSQQLPDLTKAGVSPEEPVVGIIEFGNGGTWSSVEVDVPPPDATNDLPVRFSRSGVSLSVPAGAIRVFARNDRNAPLIVNPAVPISNPGPNPVNPLVIAHVSYMSTYGSIPPTRTLYVAGNGAQLAGGGEGITVHVPPFATGVRWYTSGAPSAAIDFILVDGSGTSLRNVAVVAGTDGHVDFSGVISRIIVQNNNAGPINVTAVFDIGNF